jgi:hypothetical protein
MTTTTTRLRSWRLPVAAVGLTLTFGLIAGCGDDDEADTTDTTASEETTTTEAAEETTTTEEPEETTTTEEVEETTTTGSDTTGTTEVEADEEVADSTWASNASEFNGQIGERIGYKCTPDGTAGSVWGTEIYTDDSSVCTAGVHAGLITLEDGGRVVIEIAEGLEEYTGSLENGIESYDYGSWGGSFFFPAAGEPEIEVAGGNATAG